MVAAAFHPVRRSDRSAALSARILLRQIAESWSCHGAVPFYFFMFSMFLVFAGFVGFSNETRLK
jgi:hypothetical protein